MSDIDTTCLYSKKYGDVGDIRLIPWFNPTLSDFRNFQRGAFYKI